jgi:hypothetical protein
MLPYYKIGNLGQQSTPLPPSAPKPNVTGEEGEHEDEDETEYDD